MTNGIEYLLVPEVAERLRVTDESVRRLCKTGALPATRLGAGWRIRPTDLDTFMATPDAKVSRPGRGRKAAR